MSYPSLPFIILNHSSMFGFDEIIVLLNGKLRYGKIQDDGKTRIGNFKVNLMDEITGDVFQPENYHYYSLSFPIHNTGEYKYTPNGSFKDGIYDNKKYAVCYNENGKKRALKNMGKPWLEMLFEYIEICSELALKHPELKCMFSV